MRFSRRAVAILFVCLAACGGGTTTPTNSAGGGGGGGGGSGGGGGGSPADAEVTVADNSFSPGSVSVSVGATVAWNWFGGYSSHSVTFDDNNLGGSGSQYTGTYQKMFPTAGTFTYHCTVHPGIMTGRVIVQ